MTAKWVVTTATERVAMDQSRTAEVTFTVTNQSLRNARAVFDIRTGEGVDESWFTIDDPQRPIKPAASVPYLVSVKVPPTAPPGSYEFEARVYPPDSAPEENFVLSRRVLLEVPAPPAPVKKPFPWWMVIAAALLVLVIGVITWVVWPSSAEPEVAPSASPSPSVSASAAPVVFAAVPKLAGLSLADAKAALVKAGFVVGAVQYNWDNGRGPGSVVRQSLPAGLFAGKGSIVDLGIGAAASKPVVSAPANNSSVPPGRMPNVVWTQPDSWPARWLVSVQIERCTRNILGETCGPIQLVPGQVVTAREVTPAMPVLNYNVVNNTRDSGWVIVNVQVLDDYGTATEAGTVRFYLEH
ncbi:hypothetical protein F4553_006395 [Allocatelliglobosispora scoriae]|uniref:PASTA domain-containing protein n=1 Tax=Allocatelliglobosispora scoriae TaxID=643052 RepID=A0A841C269_9ACTN|nr:Stk1 family PASTA domain-containing Ser/Thr kinase [Allocatelliglobosispora scoriae]MBB5872961.1 hypothetical protein [Allocatelliglobosispora scoriae]